MRYVYAGLDTVTLLRQRPSELSMAEISTYRRQASQDGLADLTRSLQLWHCHLAARHNVVLWTSELAVLLARFPILHATLHLCLLGHRISYKSVWRRWLGDSNQYLLSTRSRITSLLLICSSPPWPGTSSEFHAIPPTRTINTDETRRHVPRIRSLHHARVLHYLLDGLRGTWRKLQRQS